MSSGIVVHTVDDERKHISVNGELLVYLSHDDDGWSGMEKIVSLVADIAETFDIPIIYTEGDMNE